ncbi:hypothetical protein [Microcoleus sp. S36b_A4]
MSVRFGEVVVWLALQVLVNRASIFLKLTIAVLQVSVNGWL